MGVRDGLRDTQKDVRGAGHGVMSVWRIAKRLGAAVVTVGAVIFGFSLLRETPDAVENTSNILQNIPDTLASGAEGLWEHAKDLVGMGGEPSSAPSAHVEMTDPIADRIRQAMGEGSAYMHGANGEIVGQGPVEIVNGEARIVSGPNVGMHAPVCEGGDTTWCAEVGTNHDDPIGDLIARTSN